MPLNWDDIPYDARDAVAKRLGIEPDAADDDTEESVSVDADVQDAVNHLAELPRPLLPKSYTPPTQAYTIIDAALSLSGALNGAPLVARTPDGFSITLLPRLRMTYTAHELAATVIGWQVRDSSGWRILSSQHYPKLTPPETGRILVFYWLGEDTHG